MGKHSINNSLNAFTAYMDRHNMRKTPERFAIFDRVMAMPDHFFIDELYCAMDKSDYRVSRGTIYNTVNLLVDAGLLIRHKFGNNPAQYERTSDVVRHHHLVCTQCGRIKEIIDHDIDTLLDRRQFTDFTPHYTELSIYGICRKCSRKLRPNGNQYSPNSKK